MAAAGNALTEADTWNAELLPIARYFSLLPYVKTTHLTSYKEALMLTQLKSVFIVPLLITLAITPTPARAVFIDFDDIVAPPFNPFGCETPTTPCGLILSNEYQSQGLTFGIDAWLAGEFQTDGTYKNKVVGLNTLYLFFTDALPNFISLNINSPLGHEASYLEVWGKNGFLFTYITSGWRGIDEGTPYIPDEFISFYAPEQITQINIFSFYNHRAGPNIDNLTFEYRTVPEPSLLMLFALGVAGIIRARIVTLYQVK